MTVCIGALCEANTADNRASIILCADTLITYSADGHPLTTNPNGSKLSPLPLGFYCAIADDLTHTHIFVSKLADRMNRLFPDDPALYDKVKLCIEDTAEYIRKWRLLEIIGKRGITLDEYLHDQNLIVRPDIESEMQNPDLPVELIVAGFGGGRPVLFYNDGLHTQEQATLGFFAGGSGSLLATCWLNFREQALSMSAQRTLYHVLEAKKFSEKNPTVGRRTIVLYMKPNSTSQLDLGEQSPTLLKEWGDSFWVKFTEPLDKDSRHAEIFKSFRPC